MKFIKFILPVFMLLIACPVYSQMLEGIVGGGPAAAPAAVCPDATLLICEDFEGTTDCGNAETLCRNTWIDTGTVDFSVAGQSMEGANAATIDANGGAAEEIYYDFGATISEVWAYFMVKPTKNVEGSRIFTGFSSGGNSASERFYVYLTVDGNLSVHTESVTAATSTNAMTDGTLYHIWTYYQAAASDAVAWACFSTTSSRPDPATSGNCSYTAISTTNVAVDVFFLRNGASGSQAIAITVDKIKVDNAAITN